MGNNGHDFKGSLNPNYKTGMCVNGKFHPIYNSWRGMRERCYNKQNKAYRHYGGRGIVVCESWNNNSKTFYEWAINNGYRAGLTLERKDVNGNYCPENCTWVTKTENARNKRNPLLSIEDVKIIKHDLLRTRSLSEVAREYKVTPQTIWAIKHGKTYKDI